MTEEELRKAAALYADSLPDDNKINEWANETGLSPDRIREIYCEVIGDPTAFDPLDIHVDTGQ